MAVLPSAGCQGCRTPASALPPLSMAFQPILRSDAAGRRVYAYEALVRGPAGEGAGGVLGAVTEANRYAFDQACRVRAIEMAAALGLSGTEARLSINFMPNAVYEPRACIRATLAAAERTALPRDRLIFEFTENEAVQDPAHLLRILACYREIGFRTAIDDFGAGHSGLTLLADFQPDAVKLDMALVRGVDQDSRRRSIIRHMASLCADLGCDVVAEGIETEAEFRALQDLGIMLFQGYLIGRPGFESLPRLALAA